MNFVTRDELMYRLSLLGGGSQAALQVQDEGSNLGAAGTVDTIDFVGAGVAATRLGNVVTVTVSGGGGGLSQAQALALGLGA